MYKNTPLLIKEIAKGFGFYQTSSSEYSTLSPSLTTPTEGEYVNQVNGLITNENIAESRANFMQFPHDAWDVATTYSKADLVIEAGVSYEYINDTDSAGNLVTNTTYWFALDQDNEYLIQKRFQGAKKAIDTVLNSKKVRNKIKSIYDNIALFDGVANYNSPVINNDNFVGLRFRMKSDRSLVTTINKIGTQFTEVINPLTLYLYHSSQQTPLAIYIVNHSKANSFVWSNLSKNNELRYLDDNYDAGGEFFLGYAQSSLVTAQALKMSNIDWINGNGCTSCPGNTSYNWYKNFSEYVDVMGFSIPESEFDVGVDLFDPSKIEIKSDNNFGLNINMTNDCDLTPFFLQEKRLFSEAANNVTGLEILRDMAESTRGSNGLANQVAVQAAKQTFTVDGVFGTVLDVTNQSLKALSFDLSGLQDDCLTCHNPTVSDGYSSYEIEIDNPLGV